MPISALARNAVGAIALHALVTVSRLALDPMGRRRLMCASRGGLRGPYDMKLAGSTDWPIMARNVKVTNKKPNPNATVTAIPANVLLR